MVDERFNPGSGDKSRLSSMIDKQQEQKPSSQEEDGVANDIVAPDTSEDGDFPESSIPKVRLLLDDFNQFRYRCGVVVNDENVQLFIVVLIAINAIMMGVGTFGFVTSNPRVENAFEEADQVFLIIFTIELGMQFIYHGWRLLLDGWLVFDLVVIAISWSFSSVQIIRAFRIFRALRLVTRIEVMKNLVLALFGVMPRMCAIGILLLLVSYIFAVMFTQLFKDLYPEYTSENYFGRMDLTFFTLFQIMTLDSWADIAREVMTVHWWAWLPFISFVIVTGFIVVNLIIAVICDAISALNDDEKAKLEGQYENRQNADMDREGSNNSPLGNSQGYPGDTGTSPPPEADVQEQLDALEAQVEELTRIQVQTLYTLEYLARQLQRARD